MTYAAEVLADSPLAYYRLGEASGTTMADSSGNARDGSYIGSPTLGATGLLTADANTAVAFPANAAHYGSIADAAWMDVASLTLEAWIQPTNFSATRMVMGRDIGGSAANRVFQLRVETTGRVGVILFLNGSGTTFSFLTSTTVLTAGAGAHVVATFDGSVIRLYINGVLDSTLAAVGTLNSGADLQISRIASASPSPFFGTIDEVAYYGTVLTAARIARHYLAGKAHALLDYDAEVTADTPLAHWPLAETSGTTMLDTSGNSRNGVIDAGVLLNQSSIVPSESTGAWETDAIEGGEVAVASWMAPASALSAEVWFRPTSFAGNGAVLIGRADPGLANSAANKPWYVFCTNTGVLQARLYTDAGVTVLLQSAAAVFALNTVHHVVVTHDGTTARAYVNGVLVASAALSGVPVSTTTSTKNLTVARDDAAGTYTLTGKVQHAAFYGSALSTDRVVQHYLSGIYGPDAISSNVTLTGQVQPYTGAMDITVNTDADLTGQMTAYTGDFDAVITEPADVTLTGQMTAYTGDFDAEVASIEATLTGEMQPFTGSLDIDHTAGVTLDGRMGDYTGDLTLNATGTVMHIDAHLTPFTGTFTIENPVQSGDGSNRVNGRDRQGIGVATWDPAIIPIPGTPEFLNFDVALAFTEPVITADRPPAFTAYGVTRPRPIDRLVVGGVDVTFFRGIPTPFPGFSRVEPLGYGPTMIEFPQIAGAFEKAGEGALRWLRPGSPVRIERINLTTEPPEVIAVDYRGVVVGFDLQGGRLTAQIGGELSGRAALMNRQPPLFPGRNDLGFWAMKAIRDLGLKSHSRTGPDTGVVATAFGGISMLEYLNQIIAMAYTRNGERWTLKPTAAGTYRMLRKDTETIRGTVYADDGRTVADLHRDIAEEPNRIYMTGVTPDGERVRFGAYPGLKQTEAPTYPMFDGSPFGEGTTNGDTDTGDGISVMLARLQAMKYLDYADAPGGYDADVTRAIRELQRDAGINDTGNMTEVTWRALFDLSVTGFSLRRSHILPAASRSKVRPWRRSASGAIIARNPSYDPKVMKVDRNVDVGAGFTRGQMREWAQSELADGDDSNWVGTITFNTGALIDGIHIPGTPITAADLLPARDLREGDNLWLPLMEGGDGILVHVSGVTVSASGTVTATVDTRARDDMEVWEIITRNRESRRSPYREWLRDRRASTVTKDAMMPWDEVGGRLFQRIDIPGHTWVVFPVVAGQEGQVRLLDVDTNPNAEYVVAIFGRQIRPLRLQRQIGNPLSGAGRKRWEKESIRDDLDETNVLLYVAGSDTEPCGYFPKTKTGAPDDGDSSFSAPLTGRWKDEAGFPYYTAAEPVLYVAVYADRDTSIPGGRLMWNQLEAGV